MRYYKKTDGDKLLLIGMGEGGEEITKDEYDVLLEEIRNTPFEMPEPPEDYEISSEEALNIITEGAV
jgi:hypothetical protein